MPAQRHDEGPGRTGPPGRLFDCHSVTDLPETPHLGNPSQPEIDQRVVDYEPPALLGWVHEAERLDVS